jgi:hypothetical protein
MNGKISSLNFKQKVGRYQLSIYWTFMKLFIDLISCMKMSRLNLFRYSLGGAALDWCQSLPTASINSLTGFHTTFNSFCKDYFPAEHLYESCCDEFSLFHEASVGPENHVCDEAFTVEESIFYENLEALNDIHYVIPSTETSDIISDTSVLLDVHKDQHASCENSEFIEQMLSTVDSSPGYGVEADVLGSPAMMKKTLFLKKRWLWRRILLFSFKRFPMIYFYLGLKRKIICMNNQKQQLLLSLKWIFLTKPSWGRKSSKNVLNIDSQYIPRDNSNNTEIPLTRMRLSLSLFFLLQLQLQTCALMKK